MLRALVLVTLLSCARADQEGPYTYTVTNGTATITDFDDTYSGALSITNTLGGYPVAAIDGFAFADSTGLTSVTIPATLNSISGEAFAFCTNLSSFAVHPANPSFSTLDGVLFNKDHTAIVRCPKAIAGRYTIPASVTTLCDAAFARCERLTSITLPSSITVIGDRAFAGCTNLTSVTIPANVTSIGSGAFATCTRLSSVVIPPGVTNIGSLAFFRCRGLASVLIPASVTNIGTAAFRSCPSLASIDVDIANPYFRTVDGLLFNATQTTLIEYPAGKVGSYAIPGTVTTIGAHAFAFCTNLTSVTIPSSVTAIGELAFDNCRSLNSVTIPSSVTAIGDFAFLYCRNLTRVYFAGNAPSFAPAEEPFDPNVFASTPATVYYRPGTTGWGPTYCGRPTAVWTNDVTGATSPPAPAPH